MLHSEWDARWPDIGMWNHARQRQGFKGDGVGTEVHYKTGATLGLAHTPSVIALGCLDERDERGVG